MTGDSIFRRGRARAIGAAVLSLALLTSCAPATTRSASVPEPAPCMDSAYLQLQAEPPDSLSEREWQRLQTLDRDCRVARTEASRHSGAWMDGDHHHAWWTGAGLVMALMMIGMWSG